MATTVPVLLLLLLLLCPAVPEKTQPCNYTLTYLYIGQSMPSEDSPRFQATGFLNDKEFLNYNSKDRKAKPQGPWKDIEEMENWEEESQLQRAREAIFMDTLEDIMAFYNDSNGSHILQERLGCEVHNNISSGAFWKSAYDGKDFIEFNREIPTWVPLDPAAWNTKKKWEAEEVYVHRAKAYLEQECPDLLRGYLNYSRHILDQQGTHYFLIPCQPGPGGEGTYLSTMELSVLPQDRDAYSCLVEHSALAQPLSVAWDGRQEAGAGSTVGTHPQ
ncbi:zinc-alpha-2-glycoprotein-like [Otolemur garnettii]|uniref:zinc-alpha-2-glycoprotein-like n=1 Tax=Otolemur garnettii TaxID=30611 RepID=UPI0006446E30|nr:zinc-alpha-2-glycoprotein-like [Otolemur garnettii]